MQTTDVIQELDNDGLALIAEADRLMNSTYEMLDEARRAMEDDTLSEEESGNTFQSAQEWQEAMPWRIWAI